MAETVPMTVRLPGDMAEALRTYAFVTERSVNDTVKKAVADYLQEHGRPEAVRAAFESVLSQHEVALDKLRDL